MRVQLLLEQNIPLYRVIWNTSMTASNLYFVGIRPLYRVSLGLNFIIFSDEAKKVEYIRRLFVLNVILKVSLIFNIQW